jgi:hypothetical protein
VTVALVAVVLAGCGTGQDADEEASDPGASSSSAPQSAAGSKKPRPSKSEAIPADAPDCADVWHTGGRIPRIYPGCMEGEDFVERDASACSSGQRLVRYRNFFGVPGGTVQTGTKPLRDDPEFRRAARDCVA